MAAYPDTCFSFILSDIVSKDGAKDLLIPAIHACIQNVDVAAGQMEVHLLPGLR